VAASIREFGFLNPVLVGNEGVLICGHTRWMVAAIAHEIERIPEQEFVGSFHLYSSR